MCFISEIYRTPVVLTAAAATLVALMLGSCPGVGRVPGGDGASRSGFQCRARVLRARA